VLADLPTLWKRLFDEQGMIAAVIDSYDPRTPATILAFGALVFVTDEFMAEARTGREPGLTERLIRSELLRQNHTNFAPR
jgi:hypothetical protein